MAFGKQKKKKKESRKDRKQRKIRFKDYPHLLNVKPKEKYVFHSDFFEIDNSVAAILSFFHRQGAADNFAPFWGINRIPSELDQDVSVVLFEQTQRLGEGWITDHQSRAESVSNMNLNEQEGSRSTIDQKRRLAANAQDLEVISSEIANGASYLNVHNRLLVKAPNLEALEKAITQIERLYVDRFSTLEIDSYPGEQRSELSNLFRKNEIKKGRGFYFTSVEYAGSHHLVTNGLSDDTGEYVGYMMEDVNNSAVLFDVNRYKHHIVISSDHVNEDLGRIHVTDLWGSKIGQSCLLNNHKVVHLVLDGADLDRLGPKFEKITSKIDMSSGDVNMFEMFGRHKDEMSIYASQMQKMILMAEQGYETTEADRSIIRNTLEDVLTKFYVENRMWRYNAKANRDKIRVVGIPHQDVPRLNDFIKYLALEHKKLLTSAAQDQDQLHAVKVLYGLFQNMLTTNGDLFDNPTTDKIDDAAYGSRVIYDFSRLMQRGKGVAMAQFVNILGFAVNNLGQGDTVIIHGAELINDSVKEYVINQFDRLFEKGGRVCYLYNKINHMLDDTAFNNFDTADYLIFGTMTPNLVEKYQEKLGQSIPPDLQQPLTGKSPDIGYIRRGFDNIIFRLDLSLGIDFNDLRKGVKKS